MKLSNLHIDLIEEALMIALRDRYCMPNNMIDFKKKYDLIMETYELIQQLRSTTEERL